MAKIRNLKGLLAATHTVDLPDLVSYMNENCRVTLRLLVEDEVDQDGIEVLGLAADGSQAVNHFRSYPLELDEFWGTVRLIEARLESRTAAEAASNRYEELVRLHEGLLQARAAALATAARLKREIAAASKAVSAAETSMFQAEQRADLMDAKGEEHFKDGGSRRWTR